jgi:hypothetical protein
MKKLMLQSAMAAIIAAAALAATTAAASAAIACNATGDCWHVKGHYNYDPSFGVVVHDNNWHWGHNDHFRWHEHAGRGYWRNGAWVTF